MTCLNDALRSATRRLEVAGVPDPRLDAELLLARLLGTDRGGLVARRRDALDGDRAAGYEDWVSRREGREPLQHITGVQEFYGVELSVDRGALIPRQETECVVDAVLALELPRRAQVADIGTGSGCIAIALALNRRDLDLFALERSADALQLATENAVRHDVEERIEFALGDLASPPESWWEKMDVVVSNPPYVREDEIEQLQPEVRDFDPREALVSGPTGLESYRRLLRSALDLLRPEGAIVLELGWDQAASVRQLAAEAGFRGIEVRPDLRSVPRVLIGERP